MFMRFLGDINTPWSLINLLILLSLSWWAADAAEPVASRPPCATCGFEPEAHALTKLLTQYQSLAENGGWPTWKPGKKITPHTSDTRIPTLRQILTITGDYSGAPHTTLSAMHYDDMLEEAVKHFQMRHGLTADGTLGKATQEALAVPVETRITEISGTINRIRSHTQPLEPRFILVNLPAFTLYAVERDHPTVSMRVIIGDRKNPTPLFDNDVTDVIFNPQWHVPERIAKKELTPKLKKDPKYFIHAGFVVTQDGEPVDPLHADMQGGKFEFRQLSGDENALGKIKFNIPDTDNIYLHSTSMPQLFRKDERALSHGCIRVENPRALAYYMFEGKPEWTSERIDKTYDGNKERWVKVLPTAVHLVYWTAFVDGLGVAHFFSDVYGIDEGKIAENKSENRLTLAAQ